MKPSTPSERMRQIHEAFDAWLKKADPHNLFVTSHGFAREAWQDATLSLPSEKGDTARLDWLETLPCGITINADRDHQARLMTRQQPGYLRDFIDAVRKERAGPDFNQEVNLHADTIAERHDEQFDKEQKSWEWPVNTVGRLVNNLKTLPPEMPFYTAYFVEINGVRVAKTTYPSLSRETVYEGKIQKFSAENTSLVLWASQEHPSARSDSFTVDVCEALFGCFMCPTGNNQFICGVCDWPIPIGDWVKAEHHKSCIINRVRDYLAKYRPDTVPGYVEQKPHG